MRGTILTKDPGDHLHQCVWDIWVFLKYLKVNLDGRVSKLLSILIPLVLGNRPNKLVRKLHRNLVAANLEELVHVAHVPVLIGSEFFA